MDNKHPKKFMFPRKQEVGIYQKLTGLTVQFLTQ